MKAAEPAANSFKKTQKGFNKKKNTKLIKSANVWLGEKEEKPEPESASVGEVTKTPLFKVNEKGKKVKQFKDGVERPWIDLDYKEDDKTIFYDGFFIKREDAAKIDNMKDDLRDQGLDKREVRTL